MMILKILIFFLFMGGFNSCTTSQNLSQIPDQNRNIIHYGNLTNSFSSNSENWRMLNENAIIDWVVDESQNGFVLEKYTKQKGIRYFRSSEKYSGDKRELYCKNIYFDMKLLSDSSESIIASPIMIYGKNKKLLRYIDKTQKIKPVSDKWLRFEFPLSSNSSNWYISNDEISEDELRSLKFNKFSKADRLDFFKVLSDVDSFLIQGKYYKGNDSIALDNIFFGSPENEINKCKDFNASEDQLFSGKVKYGLDLIYEGSGEIYDILNKNIKKIPKENMHNILIIGEGYKKEDIEAGFFYDDVRRWIDDTSKVEPLKSFKNAFRIYQYNEASNEYISEKEESTNTFLQISLDSKKELRTNKPNTASIVWNIIKSNKLNSNNYYPPKGITHNLNKNITVVILIMDPNTKKSGYSGVSRKFLDPETKKNIGVAIARNPPHEFLHAFSHIRDEYIKKEDTNLIKNFDPIESSNNLSNISPYRDAKLTSWAHLLKGGKYNLNTKDLIGTFGTEKNGFHSEAMCLMNGGHDNKLYFGGNGNLRDHNQLCNWCREITIFRLYEKIGIFNNPNTDFTTWKNEYRDKYYEWYGFIVPAEVPRKNSNGEPIYPLTQ
jgi:hypothetical protein